MGVPPGAVLESVAAKADYCGSPEHKDTPSFAGLPRPRADASLCDRRFRAELATVTLWLRDGIRRGAVSEFWEGGFPRYVWYKDGNVVYEARLVNSGDGAYKGYPLRDDDWPPRIEKYYGT